MPIAPEPKWKSTIADMKPDKTPQWAKNLADAIDGMVSNQAQLTGITGSVTFTFNKAIFMTQLMAVSAVPAAPAAAQAISSAWGSAMTASTCIVAPGASLGAPTPATIWSVIITSLIDPPSVIAAQTALMGTLSSMQGVKNAMDSKMGPALRTAFISCTVTVNGLNSLPPPPAGPGPIPLVAPMTPFM